MAANTLQPENWDYKMNWVSGSARVRLISLPLVATLFGFQSTVGQGWCANGQFSVVACAEASGSQKDAMLDAASHITGSDPTCDSLRVKAISLINSNNVRVGNVQLYNPEWEGMHKTDHTFPDIVLDTMFFNQPPPLALTWILAHEVTHHHLNTTDNSVANGWANACWDSAPAPNDDELELGGPFAASMPVPRSDRIEDRIRLRNIQAVDTTELLIAAARIVKATIPGSGSLAITALPSSKLEAFTSRVAQSLSATAAKHGLEGACVSRCAVRVDATLSFASATIDGSLGTVFINKTIRLEDGSADGQGIEVKMRRAEVGWRFVSATTVVTN